MTRPPSQRLDADERALAALLPRPHGRVEPGPELDARILAAARAATQPQPANGPRRRWIGTAALAASLVLAVGLAWQMRAPPAADAPVQATDAASADPAATPMQAFEAPPASPALEVAPPEHVVAQTRRAAATVAATHAAAPPAAADTAAVAPPPPPAPAAPAAASVAGIAAMPQAAEAARAQPQAQAKAGAGDPIRERAAASANAAAPARDQAGNAAAETADGLGIDDPGEDVPPATADSPAVRDAWLRRIGELLAEGKADDAKASLAEFRRRYPEATLPPELRTLEP